jgi:hypothetical protein
VRGRVCGRGALLQLSEERLPGRGHRELSTTI